ncbi:MAG: hypothetical protein ACE5LS_05410 [Thermoplasmata archaeon]
MRPGMHYVFVFLLVALFLVAAPAGGQASVGLPTYTAGDFWTYDLALLAPLDLPENTSAAFTLAGNSTVTIQESEMRSIGGEIRSVFQATHALRASAVGSASIAFFDETTNATFTAVASVDETVYLDTEGLEVWERHTEFTLDASVDLEIGGVTVSTSIEANGTVDLILNYTVNTWNFPLTVGNTGEERVNATGSSFFQLTFLDDVNTSSTPLAFNATSSFEALSEETIDVPAGSFTTVVVANTPVAEEPLMPTNVTTLAYWSGAVGAPVRYVVTNETGEAQVELVLTSYRYQAAESISILGLDIAVALPILVGVAAVAIILAVVLGRRRRRPAAPPPPGP